MVLKIIILSLLNLDKYSFTFVKQIIVYPLKLRDRMENYYPKYALLNDSQIADGFHRLFSVILSLSWGKNARCKKNISDHGITFLQRPD